ncbi:MAG: hypothetical protein K0Q68_376 [Moraxellaceae bacterium]|nr:hypothetical protein [Moraxellaceae bacterium]
MPRPIDDLGPDFDHRWRLAPQAQRREVIAQLRDLYLMLEERDAMLLSRWKGDSLPFPGDTAADEPPAKAPKGQVSLFEETIPASPMPATIPGTAAKENPFLPRSMLDRLQESRRASAGLRDLVQALGDGGTPPLATTAAVASAVPLPASHEQSDLERELRLKLGPLVESLVEAQMEHIKSELRVRLRLEMDRLIAEHIRK